LYFGLRNILYKNEEEDEESARVGGR